VETKALKRPQPFRNQKNPEGLSELSLPLERWEDDEMLGGFAVAVPS
jgi:hypothetical protein